MMLSKKFTKKRAIDSNLSDLKSLLEDELGLQFRKGQPEEAE